MEDFVHLKYIISSVVYSLIGIIILFASFWVLEKVTPEDLRKEIMEKHNIALAILGAGFMVALGLIISSAIHG